MQDSNLYSAEGTGGKRGGKMQFSLNFVSKENKIAMQLVHKAKFNI